MSPAKGECSDKPLVLLKSIIYKGIKLKLDTDLSGFANKTNPIKSDVAPAKM